MITALWTAALAVAILWPGRALSAVDGMPLDGRVEALLIGVVVPALWWAHRTFLTRRTVRVLIVALLALKIAGSLLLTQQGLCARFSTPAPFSANVLTIPIEEPRGFLRSWDVRADWRADTPVCTAIVDRSYETAAAFPSWFVNFTDAVNGGRRGLALDLAGYVRVAERGAFSLQLDRDMAVEGRVGTHAVSSTAGQTLTAALEPGTHRVDLHARLTGERWKLMPRWNDRDAFRAAAMTIAEPSGSDGWLAAMLAFMCTAIVVVLAGWWTASLLAAHRASPYLIAWCVLASVVLAAVGTLGRAERFASVLLIGAVFVPVAVPHRNLRGAFLLIGAPWLALFAARSLPQVGHFSAYSVDDWLAYQVAGYRIVMNGFWLQGGNDVFDYQPLYRWLTGLLHVVFGDSSVGEVYLDSACLLMGALLCFSIVKSAADFRLALAAAATTLAIFTLSTVWYFFGRGLSEIAAAGWSFLAAGFLLRARLGRLRAAWAAGVFAALMFYTRLNHLLFAGFLLACLLPIRAPARCREAIEALRLVNRRAAAVYAATFAAAVALFAARTWWYTGVFSVLHGTSLKNNDTGLRLATIFSGEVWGRVAHSVLALVWMNEPPVPDPRAAIVVAGAVLSALALLQVPRVSRLPLSIAIVTAGATVSSFFAHTHHYPGRMSIHLVPFAVAMTACAAGRMFPARSRETVNPPARAQVPA